jgi:EAL domain-containing protein (putative c-di-GMP-specific phosphodiesterase class I)
MTPPGDPPLTDRQKAIAQRLPSGETLLLDYVHKLERHRRGRQAVLLRMSQLQAVNRRENHLRMAQSAFETLVKQLKGQIFTMSNADIIFVFKESVLDDVEAAIVRIKFMFSDDPLLAGEDRGGPKNFADWFLLERDYDALLQLAQHMVSEEHVRRTQEFAQSRVADATQKPARRGDPLTPAVLAKMEDALARADLANMMRRQAVSAIVGRAPPQPVFYELFVSIADLRETLQPNINLASSPWLFQQLTETLDRRVLSLLNKHDDRSVAGDVSINLNVQTLVSQEFLNFDDNIKASMRGTIVIELQKVDIFADLGAFLFARDFAHERAYRICIDGANLESLPFIDRERLGVDLIKIMWDPALTSGILPDGSLFEDYIRRCGPSRAILARCDAQDAISYGQSVGMTLFQGRHVEAIVAAEMQKQKGSLMRRRR